MCATAAQIASQRMSPQYLRALRESVEQACGLPRYTGWDRKATAHAEIVNLLADASGDPVLTLLLRNVPGQLHDLMIAVGPAASGITAGSRRRLLVLFEAGDADGAAREMEQHLGVLLWMRRLSGQLDPDRRVATS